MHPLRRAQIAYLETDKAFIKIPSKYANFADVFSPKLAIKLLKHTKINNHTIELVDDWKPLYSSIYSLGPVELETLKTYIENNLANDFIRPFKFFAKPLIFFNKKSDKSLWLYIDYQGLNNLIIKNWYLLSLDGESLNQLGWTWCFTQLDLTNIYHQMQIREGDK